MSGSPLSPTVIHYRQKAKCSEHYHRKSSRRFRHRRLSNHWEVHRSSTGRIYYYNIITDQSQWEKPPSIYPHHRYAITISDDDFDSLHPMEEKMKPLSTPTSPPANEQIQIDFVDPIHFDENPSLGPSESTINAILQLEHLPIQSSTNDSITRYYRGELIEHLLNWPSTQIEREATRLSNQQIRFTTSQLTSLRAQLYSMRLRFHRNYFQLLRYRSILAYRNEESIMFKSESIVS